MSKRQLILGVIRHLTRQQLEPFVESLRDTGFQGDCVFFSNSISKETARYLKRKAIRTIPFFYPAIRNQPFLLCGWRGWRILLGFLPTRDAKLKLARFFWHIFYLRFLFAYKFLLGHQEYTRVMLTDVRDVFFQSDPFSWIGSEKGVFCFAEVAGRMVGQCPRNRGMVMEVFGEEGISQLANRQISCAGTIFGTRKELLDYLEMFLDRGLSGKHLWPFKGGDQGIHNWIVHIENNPSVRLVDNEGPVFTMGCVPRKQIRQNSLGQVINYEGTVYPILHQYDRFKDLVLPSVPAKTAE